MFATERSHKMSNMRPVAVGIAGLGRSGWKIHAMLLESQPHLYTISAVFDNLADRRQEASDRFGCATYADYDSMLQDEQVELVVVALPSHLHAEYSVRALQAGKMVVCEKPMAASLAEADLMIEAARDSGRLLSVFQNRRYAPDFLTVRRVVDSGILGRIFLIRIAYHAFGRRWDWQTLQRFGGGTLNNTCPHPVDQALLLFGDGEPDVFCIRDRVLSLGDADDHVKIVLHGPGAPTIEVEVTAACAYPQDSWLVMGSKGGLSGSSERLSWRYCDFEVQDERRLDTRPTPDRSYNRDSIEWQEETWVNQQAGTEWSVGYYLDLCSAIRNNTRAPVTPESARRQMRVFDECRRA